MRRVERAEDLKGAVETAMREAEGAFGDPTVFLEQALTRPRHIEVQILADAEGEVIHLYERDCSVQRRHQKVLELAPAPNLDRRYAADYQYWPRPQGAGDRPDRGWCSEPARRVLREGHRGAGPGSRASIVEHTARLDKVVRSTDT